MNMKKKVIIISILVLILLLVVGFIFRYQIGNAVFNIKMIGVDKDIVIAKIDGLQSLEPTGYASISYDYYIDLEKKKIYEVKDYSVWGGTSHIGEGGSHYTLTRIKNLKDNDINDILKLLEEEQTYISTNTFYLDDVYIIKYQDKTVEFKKETATAIIKIIDSMK